MRMEDGRPLRRSLQGRRDEKGWISGISGCSDLRTCVSVPGHRRKRTAPRALPVSNVLSLFAS